MSVARPIGVATFDAQIPMASAERCAYPGTTLAMLRWLQMEHPGPIGETEAPPSLACGKERLLWMGHEEQGEGLQMRKVVLWMAIGAVVLLALAVGCAAPATPVATPAATPMPTTAVPTQTPPGGGGPGPQARVTATPGATPGTGLGPGPGVQMTCTPQCLGCTTTPGAGPGARVRTTLTPGAAPCITTTPDT